MIVVQNAMAAEFLQPLGNIIRKRLRSMNNLTELRGLGDGFAADGFFNLVQPQSVICRQMAHIVARRIAVPKYRGSNPTNGRPSK